MATNNQELCVITVAFPAVTDDIALDIKKKIAALTTDIKDIRIDFRLVGQRQDLP